MPRREGSGPAEGNFFAANGCSAASAERVRSSLEKSIADGILVDSLKPCWHAKSTRFQKLEWLGDAVLNFHITQQVHDFAEGAGCREGQMTLVRSACENMYCLAAVFRALNLMPLLELTQAQKYDPLLFSRDKSMCDVVEAIIGELFDAAKVDFMGRQGAPSVADSGKASIAAAALETLSALMHFIFCFGMQKCPQRIRPVPTKIVLFSLQTTVAEFTEDSSATVEAAAPINEAGIGAVAAVARKRKRPQAEALEGSVKLATETSNPSGRGECERALPDAAVTVGEPAALESSADLPAKKARLGDLSGCSACGNVQLSDVPGGAGKRNGDYRVAEDCINVHSEVAAGNGVAVSVEAEPNNITAAESERMYESVTHDLAIPKDATAGALNTTVSGSKTDKKSAKATRRRKTKVRRRLHQQKT
eukprot:TRINITY_DN20236_c0_g1_i1.p1 TRINITY_DN20236_c0_g1~~TRINITY_DN20236_c0_g1_i1.p1  ORF type:complete len:421 (+),score=81.65 TRINITY_DN20236_c0_g1_i1:103-1365(+)